VVCGCRRGCSGHRPRPRVLAVLSAGHLGADDARHNTTRRWLDGSAQLLMAEALVSGMGKPVAVPAGQHAADAIAAATALADRVMASREPMSDVRCAPHLPLNLAAVMAMWGGLGINPEELYQDVFVVRTRPVPQ
jgi:hypothetical protein